ncbi:MAG: hypothetical protein BAJALOKI2v1_720007 [Promethearchaeota archaeon]|nr:MAG: hypothetical protein BAJALOKI2v1_720007 [Candidatus Lokiarchaeota archaeon]
MKFKSKNQEKAVLRHKKFNTLFGVITLGIVGLILLILYLWSIFIANWGAEEIILSFSLLFLIPSILFIFHKRELVVNKKQNKVIYSIKIFGLIRWRRKSWDLNEIKKIKVEELEYRDDEYGNEVVNALMVELKNGESVKTFKFDTRFDAKKSIDEFNKFCHH